MSVDPAENVVLHTAWHTLFIGSSRSAPSVEEAAIVLQAVGYSRVDPDWVSSATLQKHRKDYSEVYGAQSGRCLPQRVAQAAAEALVWHPSIEPTTRKALRAAILQSVLSNKVAVKGLCQWLHDLVRCCAVPPHAAEGQLFVLTSGASAAVFWEAKLYAALCFAGGYRTIRPLAKLLTLYIHQESGLSLLKGEATEDTGALAPVRRKGVVAGILEAALCCSRHDSKAVGHALQSLTHAAGIEDQAGEWVPSAGKSEAVLQAASLLLTQLVSQTTVLERHTKGNTAATSPSADTTTAVEVVHAIQELLFTLMLGAGTIAMPNRPSPAAADPSSDGTLLTTSRPLTLGEADALTQRLFPVLVQQLGYEWPWSALLRHGRILDKQQHTPTFPGVAWGSRLVMDHIWLTVGRHRTYRDRLHALLPESYDGILEGLGLLPPPPPPITAASEEASASARTAEPPLYVMPTYYEEAGTVVVGYLERSGQGRLRVDEAERVLTQATGTLPMTARLRALAPPVAVNRSVDEGTVATEGRYPLSSAVVSALEARYRAEVLLASVVVFTQLRVVSQVQQLLRVLAPLLGKLLLMVGRTGGECPPLLTLRRTDNKAFPLEFSRLAERLMSDVGYQFYPLEWLPAVARVCNATAHRAAAGSSSSTDDWAVAPSLAAQHGTPYSVYAAVAHQLGASLRAPIGSSGELTQRHPAGARSSVVTPSSHYVSQMHLLGPQGGDTQKQAAWQRAAGILDGLMLPAYLDSCVSSCELEGTLAVTATRRVVGTAGQAAQISSAVADAVSRMSPALWKAYWQAGKAATGPGRESQTGPDQQPSQQRATAVEVEAVRDLTEALVRRGASSSVDHMVASDFLVTVAQCFMPHTYTEGGKTIAADHLLEAARAWCADMVGSAADRSRLRVLRMQQQTEPNGCLPLPLPYNSCTLDACAVGRRVLRAVPARLLEKMRLRQQTVEVLYRRRDAWLQAHAPPSVTPEGPRRQSLPHRCVDALLSHQWARWCHVLRDMAILEGGMAGEDLTAAQWLFYAPYTMDYLPEVDGGFVS